MELPIGMTQPAGEDKVLLLVNSLNGLKQSSFNWKVVANKFLNDNGFKCDGVDPCWFWKWVEDSKGKYLVMVLV